MKIDAEPIIELLEEMGIHDWWNVAKTDVEISPPGTVTVVRYPVNEHGHHYTDPETRHIMREVTVADVEWPKR